MHYLAAICTCRRHNALGSKTMGTCMTVGYGYMYDRRAQRGGTV